MAVAIEWMRRWGRWLAKTNRPGIFRLQAGGWLVRTRVTDPKTGRRKDLLRVIPDGPIQAAQAALDSLAREQRDEMTGKTPRRQRWNDYAVSLFERKCADGTIRSAKGRAKYESILRVHLFPVFGLTPCDKIRVWDVAQWRLKLSKMITDGYEATRTLRGGKVDKRRIKLDPETANTWIRLFKTICRAMVAELELDRDPSAALEVFPTGATYTDEAPNTLTASQLGAFLEEVAKVYPQHYAMILLGCATGKRPSTLRPIRATGPECDVDWDASVVKFRRSHTVGDEIMGSTKTGTTHERVALPPHVMDVLRAHRAMIASPPLNANGKPPLWWREAMASSDLLFPGRDGGPRSPSALDDLFADVSKRIGLPFAVTPRAMRRTFVDLARHAQVDIVVRESIIGHESRESTHRYSSAQLDEQREAVGKIVSLVPFLAARKAAADTTPVTTPRAATSDQ
jgi:integrase